MAKKSNRSRPKSAAKPARSAVAPARSEVEAEPVEATPVEATPATPPTPRAARAPKLSRSQAAAERLEDEYAYITGDLRRVFILAGLMFVLLIVANLVFTFIG